MYVDRSRGQTRLRSARGKSLERVQRCSTGIPGHGVLGGRSMMRTGGSPRWGTGSGRGSGVGFGEGSGSGHGCGSGECIGIQLISRRTWDDVRRSGPAMIGHLAGLKRWRAQPVKHRLDALTAGPIRFGAQIIAIQVTASE